MCTGFARAVEPVPAAQLVLSKVPGLEVKCWAVVFADFLSGSDAVQGLDVELVALKESVRQVHFYVRRVRNRLSSLHNIIFNAFCLVFVLWSLLLTNRAFYFLRPSCSKKF